LVPAATLLHPSPKAEQRTPTPSFHLLPYPETLLFHRAPKAVYRMPSAFHFSARAFPFFGARFSGLAGPVRNPVSRPMRARPVRTDQQVIAAECGLHGRAEGIYRTDFAEEPAHGG